jgi:hypothetical protein
MGKYLTAKERIAQRLKKIREQKNEDWRDKQDREQKEWKQEQKRKRSHAFREALKVGNPKLRKIILESGKTKLDRFKNFAEGAYRDFYLGDEQKKKQIKNFDKIIENTNRKLHPLTIKKLQELNPDPSKKVIPIKKEKELNVNTKIKRGYGDKLTVDASRTDPQFKKLSPPAKIEYIKFMHKQLLNNRPMNLKYVTLDRIESWTGKNIPFTEKLIKDYTQQRQIAITRGIRELKKDVVANKLLQQAAIVDEEIKKDAKLKRAIKAIEKKHQKEITREKAAGRLGDKQRIINLGIKKPPRGK